ncbi:unnamed protein product [Prunus armeniaca]|uniref:Uncharacterized protein n=1 Tax=Prunus armeniaca TaxID=36596 RepID=A0A6J5X9D5_PRUAR|nr:unnamed protein product [Prunus armeniaca]CAB4277279.1 unnamed protein product [Prunus armeniaca]CAB4307648.1 unnamed protein product [Prunus armeniaca]CAB4307684.1 unnamed protein product [Prunus armeniaca]
MGFQWSKSSFPCHDQPPSSLSLTEPGTTGMASCYNTGSLEASGGTPFFARSRSDLIRLSSEQPALQTSNVSKRKDLIPLFDRGFCSRGSRPLGRG